MRRILQSNNFYLIVLDSDIFTDKEEAFFGMILQNPNKQYFPKSLIELYYQFKLNHESHFKPNEGWHYSDINYLLLGLIIEELDKTKLAQSINLSSINKK